MQEYETIKRARATLQASRSEPSARTVATYKRRAQVLMRHVIEQEGGGIDAMIAEAKRTRSASTWFGKRAAMVYGLRQGLETLLSEQHKLQRALKALDTAPSDERWEVWRNTVGKLAINIEWIEHLEKEPGPPVGERKK